MEEDKNLHLVFAMMRFLESELLRSDMTPDSKESLEVGIQCLENVYGIFSTDDMNKAKYPMPATLPEIFNTGLEIKQKDYKPKVITEEDKTKADSHKTKGNEQMKAENFSGAVEEYTKAIEIDDENAVYFCNRAAAHSKLQHHEAALDDCIRALTIDPKYSKAYGRKGLAHTALSQYGDARQCFDKALELDPSNESYKKNLEVANQKLAEQGGGVAGGAGGPGAGGFPGGFPGMGGMGGGMGGMNFAEVLNNPALMNMATQMMSNPQMQSMMANMMSSFGGGGGAGGPEEAGGPPNMDQILQAGQQLAQQLSSSNPELVEQLREAMPGTQPPGDQPPSDNNQPGEGGTQ